MEINQHLSHIAKAFVKYRVCFQVYLRQHHGVAMVAQVQNFVKLGQTFYIRLNFRDFFLQLPIVSYIDREKKEPPWTQKQLLENINRICNLFHLLIDRPLHFSAKGQLQLLTRHPPSFGPTHQVPMQRRKACQV
jgi:hypothetical protein